MRFALHCMLGLAAAVVLLGCEASGGAADAGGDAADAGMHRAWLSEGPPIEDCFVGVNFAECGGDGPARIGCRNPAARRGDTRPPCLWFTGGEVAADYIASGCDATDACCMGSSGGWPYGEEPVATEVRYHVADFLYAWGLSPWDREREARFVPALDPQLEILPSPELLVDGAPPRSLVGFDHHFQGSFGVTATLAMGFTSEVFVLEVLPSEDELTARVCRYRTADGQVLGCDPAFHSGATCAVEADITLSHVPTTQTELASMAVRVRAEMSDGTVVELSL